MTYVFLGVLGAILALLLLGAGIYVGMLIQRHIYANTASQTKPETPAEAERRRLIEDQQAFTTLMNYSPDMAYGFVSAADVAGIKDGDG